MVIDSNWFVVKEPDGTNIFEPEEGIVFSSKHLVNSFEFFLDAQEQYIKKFIKNNDVLDKKILHQKVEQRKNTICFKISRKEMSDANILLKFSTIARKLHECGKQIRFVVNEPIYDKKNDAPVEYNYSEEELNNIQKLNKRLIKNGITEPIVFCEFDEINYIHDFKNLWTLERVQQANNYINNDVEMIKNNKLTPFETMLYLHTYLTETKKMADEEDYGIVDVNFKEQERGRVITNIIRSNGIYCSGFASYVKAVVDKLNTSNLKCDILGCELYDQTETYDFLGGHCQNLIYINDEKYNIKGYYIEDACWDCKDEDFGLGKGFLNCLIPIGDLENIYGVHYVQKYSDYRLDNLLFDSSDATLDEDEDEDEEYIDYPENNLMLFLEKLRNQSKSTESEREEDKALKKRKQKVETKADVVKMYKDKSPAIARKKYKEGLIAFRQKLSQNMEKCDDEQTEENFYAGLHKYTIQDIEMKLLNSKIQAITKLEDNPISAFGSDIRYFRKKRLKENSKNRAQFNEKFINVVNVVPNKYIEKEPRENEQER